jgi:TRAP-type mannitol/chloroaromatic compound transport system permease small subunit
LNNGEIAEQGKPLKALNRWLERITRFFITISALMVILMALTTTYAVIRRYIFGKPDNNAFLAICIITLIFAVFSWAEVQRLKRHIVVDYFSDRFSPNIKDILENIITPILGLFFCGVLAWKNWTAAAFSLKIGESTVTNTVLPVFPFRVMITFGVMLVCVVLLTQFVTYLVSLRYRMVRNKQQHT